MGTLLKKLDSKANNNMVIFNMPPEFEPVERNLHKDIHIYKSNTAIKTEFILIFIKTRIANQGLAVFSVVFFGLKKTTKRLDATSCIKLL